MLKLLSLAVAFLVVLPNTWSSQRWVLESKSATALNTVTLYPDSSFFKHSNRFFEEGTLFEVLDETIEEHEDSGQDQKFKWYKVKTNTGRVGWVFGEGLAVIVPDYSVDQQIQKYHKRKIQLTSGFENALMWVAAIQGRDNFHQQDYLNPIYNEYYLVITNQFGKSVHINISGVNARGQSQLTNFDLVDVNQDQIPDIVVQTISSSNENDLQHRNLEIYSTQAGTLMKVLEERLTLTYEDDLKSPALSKSIEIEEGIIRVEYVDYLLCEDYQQPISVQAIGNDMERCMEYVTYSYIWNPRKKQFETLYDESRTTVKGSSTYETYLKEYPASSSGSLTKVSLNERLKVIKHFEKMTLHGTQKKYENYCLVQTSNGALGYIPANYIRFGQYAHTPILEAYYQQAPLMKNAWTYPSDFVKMEVVKLARK